ncbi:DUF2244 domain-containing protein [Labrys monachus]|uniref:Membrane protein n=1 Tax=Labrys monachus TaxID=217067 RepID=A0ABU0F8X2_9HYPH|nr:DUF2244 domain-containing protein [Labrys monachus]MDQ0391039.1 putative membrane protein [Labrys monachus]
MTSGNPKAPMDEPVFDAILSPHRSLGPLGFRNLLIAVGTASTLLSIPFYIMGAWPVIGFFGVDVGLLYVMFKINYRGARLREHVLMTHALLRLSRMDREGRTREWSFNPRWVRLQRDEHEEFGVMRLALVQRGREVEVARFLGPREKGEFARAFTQALSIVRRG